MRFSWAEIRVRASEFAKEWADAKYEKSETQSFYNEFFEIFGVKRRSVAYYEEQVKALDNKSGYIDLFWPSVLLVEQKSAGRSLAKAREQAMTYFGALAESKRPRYLLLSDFRNFELLDMDEGKDYRFALAQLPENVEKFGFILGVQPKVFHDQDPVNIKAAEIMGRVYDELKSSGYEGPNLEQFLVRIVFCLFADDTGIFEPRDLFYDLIEHRTREDGSDLGRLLSGLFEVLNTPVDKRSRILDGDLVAFPHINGALFKDRLEHASFSSQMRKKLIAACEFDWSRISPAIFGGLFQSVMDPDERRNQGAHYTTELNILKVIGPLFLDNLRIEFSKIRTCKTMRTRKLENFQKKLGGLKFFDPACGCGNFLIIAYRELRELEIEVLQELYPAQDNGRQQDIDTAGLSCVNVDQFHGIEIGAFPVRIAETALWMMDHLMNNKISMAFGSPYVRIPLETSPTIRLCDALEIDWNEVLPAKECSYVFGNPPFSGAKMQSPKQRTQVQHIANKGKNRGTLDYVAAWFIRAGEYVQNGDARIAFVATNSIVQGEQVAQLWPTLYERLGLEISFAHQTFAWGSDAQGKAHVHVIIVGLYKADIMHKRKLLYTYENVTGDPLESKPKVITPYLLDGDPLSNPQICVRLENMPINGMPEMIIGSKPIDASHYILDAAERKELLNACPEARKYIRPYIGAKEFLNGAKRWILRVHEAPYHVQNNSAIRKRIEAVKRFRLKSKAASTRAIAYTPTLYHVNVIPKSSFLAVPVTSASRRNFIPIGWISPPTIPSDSIRLIEKADKHMFALLTSSMHMTWMRNVCGRLETRYRYSIGLVYNTFPVPKLTDAQQKSLASHTDAVLNARLNHTKQSLANLYDPELMPIDLRKAHKSLDRAVDKLYRPKKFESEIERMEHLFNLYEMMIDPINGKTKKRRKK